MPEMTISTLARQAGVGVETVRYYQRRGLIDTPESTLGSVRRYDGAALARLRFIRRAQALGFSLEEIGELLGLDEVTDRVAARAIAREKLARIEAQMAQLAAMREALVHLVDCCEHSAEPQPCPILHALAGPGETDTWSARTAPQT